MVRRRHQRDIAARRYRNRSGMNNFLSRLRMELFADTRRKKDFYPASTLVAPFRRAKSSRTPSEVINRLRRHGIIEPEG